MDVGVRELKEHLSEYLDRAARGEIIRVTERGVPKAILAPLPGEVRLQLGIEEGWIRAGVSTRPKPVRRSGARRRTTEVLGDDRNDHDDR